ncbi:16911_t:CDS:1, partial [Funneliformis caledonium]
QKKFRHTDYVGSGEILYRFKSLITPCFRYMVGYFNPKFKAKNEGKRKVLA